MPPTKRHQPSSEDLDHTDQDGPTHEEALEVAETVRILAELVLDDSIQDLRARFFERVPRERLAAQMKLAAK